MSKTIFGSIGPSRQPDAASFLDVACHVPSLTTIPVDIEET